jgi:hypothetical protein
MAAMFWFNPPFAARDGLLNTHDMDHTQTGSVNVAVEKARLVSTFVRTPVLWLKPLRST